MSADALIGDDLTPDARRVVLELASCEDDFRPYIRTVAADLDMPVENLRRILRKLSDDGFVTYGPVRDTDEGRPAGSSYWLTEAGIRLRERLAHG